MEINGLGNRLAELRKKHNLTQREMADKLNVSNQLISKWETEQVVPGVEYLIKISELFDVSLDELVLDKKQKTHLKKNKIHSSMLAMGSKIKSFAITYKKQLILSLIAFCSALFITAIALLSVYVFVPASNKHFYLNDIEQSVYNYIEENNRFQIKILGKRDDSIVSTQYLNGNIDENGIDYKVYGDLGEAEEYIVDNVVYNSQYKTEYTGNITTIRELFDQKLEQDVKILLEEEYDYGENFIKYVKKTHNGYFIKIDGNILRNKLTEEEKKDISFDGDLQGDVIIKNGIIDKIDLSITMCHKTSGKYKTQTLMEFSKEKPNITAGNSPWYHDEILSSNDFVAQTFSDYNTLNIVANTEIHQRMIDAIRKEKIKYVDGKLWFTYYLSGLAKSYIVGLNVTTGIIDFEQEIYNEDGFFYQDKFVVYNSSKLKMIDLQTQTITETKFGVDTINISTSYRIIDGDYLIVRGSKSTMGSTYYLIYNLKDNLVVGKTREHVNDEGSFSNNVLYKNKVLYYLNNDYNFGYDSDIIYSFDFDTKTETKLVSSLDGLALQFIDSKGNLYYQNYKTNTIYKIGSDFEYAYGTIYEENGLIKIVNGNELYVYDGENLISLTTYTPPHETIFENKDVLYIDRENNLVYLKNKSVVYHGSFDVYDKVAYTWLVIEGNGQLKTPLIVDCIEDYVIVKIDSTGKQYGIYKRLDVSRMYKVSNVQEDITSGSYARLEIGNDSQVLLFGNRVYLLSKKSA